MSEHPQPNIMEPRSIADEKELTNDAETPRKPCSKPQVTTQEETPPDGTTRGDKGQMRYEITIFETSNVTSLNSNRDAALARKAHSQ